jgi:subtilase family serine protease
VIRNRGMKFILVAAMCVVAVLPSHAQNLLTRHVREAVRTGVAPALAELPAGQTMQLDVVLPLSDPAGLKAFLQQVYNPASPSFRQFLTPAQFTARFGPTQADYDATVSYLQASGFTVVGGSRDGMEIQVQGSVAAVNRAFHVSMQTYQHPTEGRTFYGPDREPTTDLHFALWHVSGLDNYSIPHPMLVKRSDYAAAQGMSSEELVSHATTGSGPSASYLGSDMRAAYYGGTALTGAGQNLGLFEFLGTDLADLNTYFKNVGQTNNVPITLLSTDGTSTSCLDSRAGRECDDTEQTLDMTQALGMAPGLSSLVMYIGSTDTAIISAMTTHSPLPTTIGCSWGWTPADPTTLDPYFEKMAAQGQDFFAASGDSSTWSANNEAWPADDANIISVGGTDLVTASAAGPWRSETAWSDSGGGISPDGIGIPAWQQISGVINSSNKGSATLRNGPDVSANANFTFYTCADQQGCLANEYGGTSFATPMWAAYIALANQQSVASGGKTLGFINPTIYQQNVTSSYATDFHDITSGTSGSFSAVTGYDLVTGWGSPNGAALINALAPTSPNPAFAINSSPVSVSVVQGSSGSSTISTTVSGGFDSAVALSASGQPSGVTVSFSSLSIAAPGSGSSTMTMAVSAGTTAGTYTITVTGTGGAITHTTTVTLTVTTAVTPSFSLSVSPNSGSMVQGQNAFVVVTVTASGGFDGVVALSSPNVPHGVVTSFSPASITGSGTSDFNLSVRGISTPGTYPITITGTSGSTSESTTLTLQIIAHP